MPKECSVDVHRVAYVVLGSHTPDCPPEELVGDAPGWYPDPFEDFPFDLEAHRTAPIWVTIHIAADAAAGLYEGSALVRCSGGRLVARKPFRLKGASTLVPERTWICTERSSSPAINGSAR